jgi:4-hydroxybenzoate polyprenyltransferase
MGTGCIGNLKEFASFIRLENCLFIAGIAVSGYLIFNGPGHILIPLVLASFLGTGASYAYNHLKDTGEDAANGKRLSRFVVEERKGRAIVVSLFIAGLAFSFSFSLISWTGYALLILTSFLYSGSIRLKEKFIVKNLVTGTGIALSFVMGAAMNGLLDWPVISHAALVFLLGLAANILGDIRGHGGDSSIGMTTLPILLGKERAKIIIYTIILLLLACIFLNRQTVFYPLAPFLLASAVLLSKNRLRWTRISLLSSCAALPFFLLAFSMMGGV